MCCDYYIIVVEVVIGVIVVVIDELLVDIVDVDVKLLQSRLILYWLPFGEVFLQYNFLYSHQLLLPIRISHNPSVDINKYKKKVLQMHNKKIIFVIVTVKVI